MHLVELAPLFLPLLPFLLPMLMLVERGKLGKLLRVPLHLVHSLFMALRCFFAFPPRGEKINPSYA